MVAVRADLPENTPPDLPAQTTVDTAPGNRVVEALGGGRFALYAHLQTGSIRVVPGRPVGRGEVLGLVGNTGNSTEPHLHFHLSGGPAPLGANGFPFVIDRFRVEGRVTGLGGLVPRFAPPDPPRARTAEMPLQGDILAFP